MPPYFAVHNYTKKVLIIVKFLAKVQICLQLMFDLQGVNLWSSSISATELTFTRGEL